MIELPLGQYTGIVYFAHHIDIYGKPEESKAIAKLESFFGPRWHIENPNQEKHDKGYNKYKADGKRGMDYFFKEVLPKMNVGAFLPFQDGKLGKGVYSEMEFLSGSGNEIYEMDWNGNVWQATLNPKRCLTVEQTRARVYH